MAKKKSIFDDMLPDFDMFSGIEESPPEESSPDARPEEAQKKKNHRRTTELKEMSERFLYRRAFGEDQLLQVMGIEPLREGQTFHIMTGGNVDQLSFLKIVLLHHPHLDYLMISSWVIGGDDLLWLEEALRSHRIERMDFYLGEIYPNQYKHEWAKLKEMFSEFTEQIGRVVYFRNHAKILTGYDGDFFFTIECSANLNMNPRNEQGIITIDRGLHEFYKQYYDKIKTFGHDEDVMEHSPLTPQGGTS